MSDERNKMDGEQKFWLGVFTLIAIILCVIAISIPYGIVTHKKNMATAGFEQVQIYNCSDWIWQKKADKD